MKAFNIIIIIVITVILKALRVGGTAIANAQTASLSVWPPLLTAMVQPGKSITQVYRIKNSADDSAVTVKLAPFAAADEQGHINLFFNQTPPRFFSLLNADLPKNLPQTFNLKAGETQELVLKISIPNSAAEQDYPVALVIESDTQGLIGGSGTKAKATIASPILLTVSQTETPNRLLKIEEFAVTKKTVFQGLGRLSSWGVLDSFDPVEFVLRAKNASLSLLQPIGQIEIKNTFGRKVATLPLEPDNILGGATRQLRRKMEGSEPSILAWNPVFPLGRYTATATITPQDTTNTVSAEIVFWAIPYKAIFTLLLIGSGWKLLTNAGKGSKLKL